MEDKPVVAWLEGLGFTKEGDQWWNQHKQVSISNYAALFFYTICQKAEREALQSLLDWQDQEVDPDGRPIGDAYYVIQGDARESIELAIAHLTPPQNTNQTEDE